MRMMAIHMRSQHRRANYHAESQLIPADFARTSDSSFMNTTSMSFQGGFSTAC